VVLICFASLPARADRGVRIDDTYFDPSVVVIDAGTTVVWEHTGTAPHSVTSQPGSPESFDSGPNCSALTSLFCLHAGDRFRFTFTVPGTYTYYCKVHGKRNVKPDPNAGPQEQPCTMCGIVEVHRKASPVPSPTRTVSPKPTKSATPTAGPTAGPTASTSVSPEVAASPSATPVASRGLGGGARAGIAIVGTLVLISAGYGVWRLLIADR